MFRKVFGGTVLAHSAHALPISSTDETGPTFSPQAVTVIFVMSVTLISLLTFFVALAATVFLIKARMRNRDEDTSKEEDNQAYLELNLEEQELYFQSKEYIAANPYFRGDLTLSQNLLIQEKAIRAWEFVRDGMLTANDLLIVNKFELNFFKNFECSTQTNLPIPSVNEVYYFESKIYLLPNPKDTIISIGLGIKPYPWFRLPGRHAHSISYDSNGYRRHNQPFKFLNDPVFPELIEGDVVGIGYRVRSGTVFFTRNGKKLSELKIGGHIKNFRIPLQGQLFPIIGANNLCSVHVNVGQLGYVFIEGNVKKWGFAPLEGTGPAPPVYQKFNADILLERSEIDEENDLADRVNDFPPDFWDLAAGRSEDLLELGKFSYSAHNDGSDDERITMNSLIPHEPPQYDSHSVEEDEGDASEGDLVQTEGATEPSSEDAQPQNSPIREAETAVNLTCPTTGEDAEAQTGEDRGSQTGEYVGDVSGSIKTGEDDALQAGRDEILEISANGSDALAETPGEVENSPPEIPNEEYSRTDDQHDALPVDSNSEIGGESGV